MLSVTVKYLRLWLAFSQSGENGVWGIYDWGGNQGRVLRRIECHWVPVASVMAWEESSLAHIPSPQGFRRIWAGPCWAPPLRSHSANPNSLGSGFWLVDKPFFLHVWLPAWSLVINRVKLYTTFHPREMQISARGVATLHSGTFTQGKPLHILGSRKKSLVFKKEY